MSGNVTTPGDVGHGGSHHHGDGHGIPAQYQNPWNDTSYQPGELRDVFLAHLADKHRNDATQPPGAKEVFLHAGLTLQQIPAYRNQGGSNSGGNNGGGNSGGQHSSAGGGSSSAGGGSGAGGTVGDIISFFRGKGLNDNAIAGILGNWRIESNFSTTSYNGKEGAHGLANWEGDRWPALQQFASSLGGSPYDLNVQLEFAWHELTTRYSSVLQQLRGATSATEAANIFNRQYEGSGDYTNNREQYASAYMSNGFRGVSGVRISGSSGGATGTGNGQGVSLGPTNYKAALGNLEGLVQGIPELKGILNQAVAGGWSTDKFLQAIQGTGWWRTHDSSARSLISLSFQDPAEYHNQISGASRTIQQTASQLGVTLSGQQINTLAMRSLVEGWNSQTIQDMVGGTWEGKGGLKGQAAQTAQQLHQIYGDYGLPISDKAINDRVESILSGKTTIDTYTQAAIDAAKSMYPALAHQLNQGLTVKNVADPYIQSEANILEVDPNTLSPTSPMIKKALQGSIVQQGDKATATSTPMWQFEQRLRADPRWQYTQNAHNDVTNVLSFLGNSWGFEA
jgi:hypothetical protein